MRSRPGGAWGSTGGIKPSSCGGSAGGATGGAERGLLLDRLLVGLPWAPGRSTVISTGRSLEGPLLEDPPP